MIFGINFFFDCHIIWVFFLAWDKNRVFITLLRVYSNILILFSNWIIDRLLRGVLELADLTKIIIIIWILLL